MEVNPERRPGADDAESPTGLPASIEALWGLRGRPRKGPRPGLSIERIVEAAVQVAEAEGLAAVSMQRVAREVGTGAMSLYRYVGSKDELLALMVDTAIGSPPAKPPGEETWRDGHSRWAWGYHAVLRRHSWVLRIPMSGPQVTPNLTSWIEDALDSLRETGLTEAEKLSVVLLLSGYVRNAAALAADIAEASPEAAIMPTWGRLLRQLTEAQRYPALHAALASDVFDRDDDPEDEFVFGLERTLDGIEALVRARAPGSD